MEKFKGILWQRDSYTDRLIMLFRYASLSSGLGISLFGALVALGVFPSERFNIESFVILSTLFLIIGISQYFDRKPSMTKAISRVISLHLLAMSYLLLITGFQSPLTIAWLVLFVATYFYFDKRAFLLSVCVLALTAFLDTLLLTESITINYVINNITIFSMLTLVGSLMAWLGHIQAQEHDEFIMTRINEGLQRDRMLSLINSMGDAIINTDANGTIVTYNAASLSLFDTNESLNGKKIDDILHLKDKDGKIVPLFGTVSERGSLMLREDLSFHFGDGDVMRLSVNASPVRTSYSSVSSRGGYIFIMRDITRTKSLEEERDEFISVVSHELRTPIAIAEGTVSNAQVLMQHKAAPEKITEALAKAHEQTMYLAKMVNDLSTLSRAERGISSAPEDVDLDRLLRSLYHEYTPQAAEKKLHLNLNIKGKLGTLTTSKLYLEEILQNFITNAIKYTQQGAVTIHAERAGDNIKIGIEDTGIGISKSDQRYIFKKFYRSEDYRTRETSGTGLGLYVVGKLADKIGATIDVTSRLNHGSTFTVSVPNIKKNNDAKNKK